MSVWIAWALAVSGFATLGIAMERHVRAVLGSSLSQAKRTLLQGLGAVLLMASLAACWNRWSLSIAVAAWLGALTFGALSAAMVLTYRPRWLPLVASVTFVGGVLGWMIKLVLAP